MGLTTGPTSNAAMELRKWAGTLPGTRKHLTICEQSFKREATPCQPNSCLWLQNCACPRDGLGLAAQTATWGPAQTPGRHSPGPYHPGPSAHPLLPQSSSHSPAVLPSLGARGTLGRGRSLEVLEPSPAQRNTLRVSSQPRGHLARPRASRWLREPASPGCGGCCRRPL